MDFPNGMEFIVRSGKIVDGRCIARVHLNDTPPALWQLIDRIYMSYVIKTVPRKFNALRRWHFVLFAEGEE